MFKKIVADQSQQHDQTWKVNSKTSEVYIAYATTMSKSESGFYSFGDTLNTNLQIND